MTGSIAVASGHAETSAAALAALEAGGNAVDAAVAAGFAAALCEPALTSLGGGGFLLSKTPGRPARVYDFFADAPGRGLPAVEREPHFLPVTVRFPGSEQVFHVGLGSVAVPGNLLGFLHAHEREGALPLAEVLAPARRLAREGVVLNAFHAYVLGLLEPIMTLTERGRALFAPGGRYTREGDRLVNPELAAYLDELPKERGRDFYQGELGRRIAKEMHEGQGLLTAEDLACFEVRERAPLRARYHDHVLLTNPPPSFGGSLLALSLSLLEAAGQPAPREPTEDLRRLVGVMQEVDRLRDAGTLGADAIDPAALAAAAGRVRRFSRGTTHCSVRDASGRCASLTTSNGEGSGYLAPGTGIMLNNMLGEDDLHPEGFFAQPPGERVASMMAPSLLLRGEQVRCVLGSGGSKRIRTALLQVILRLVDHDDPLEQAVAHPRLHWDGEQVQAEPGHPEAALRALAAHCPVNAWDTRDVYFGGVHAVAEDAASGDPRRGGHAATRDAPMQPTEAGPD